MPENNANKILYFDPNDTIPSGSDPYGFNAQNTPNIFKNPEDYSIAVDLIVDYKTHNTYAVGRPETNTVRKFSLISQGKTQGFLSGSELGGSRVLTDFFTNIDQSTSDVEKVDEAMCISSIDIEFNSWYAASVIINFVDVRGAALFDPTEYGGDGNESVFKSFFSFPYPMYTLKVKGHYGDAVSYKLHCSDFKAQFNSQTGNFEITVHFIGYTYAMLNDVQVAYMMAAPYVDAKQATNIDSVGPYWASKTIEGGPYRSYEDRPLPTMISLFKKIKDASFDVAKFNAEDKVSKEAKAQEAIVVEIKEIRLKIEDYSKSFIRNFDGKLVDGKSVKSTSKVGSVYAETKIDIEKKALIALLNSFITNHKDQTTFTYKENVVPVPTQNSDTTYTLDLTELYTQAIDGGIKAEKSRSNLVVGTESSVNRLIEESIGIKPTLFNYMKVLIAHMETMYNHITEVTQKINNSKRPLSKLGISIDDTDIKGGDILTPFPWYTQNNVDTYIGDKPEYQTLEEVQLVADFIKCRADVMTKLEEINKVTALEEPTGVTTTANVEIGELWYPINAFDNSISLIGGVENTPYGTIKELSGDKLTNELISSIGIRITEILTLSSSESNDRSFAMAEANNIIDSLKSFDNLDSYVKNALNEIKKPGNIYVKHREYFPLHKKFISAGANPDKYNEYTYDLNNNKIIPLFGSTSTGYKNFVTGDKKNGNYWDQNHISKTIKIIEGVDNITKIYDRHKEIEKRIQVSTEKDMSNILDNYNLELSGNLFSSDYNENFPLSNKIFYTRLEYEEDSQNVLNAFNSALMNPKTEIFGKSNPGGNLEYNSPFWINKNTTPLKLLYSSTDRKTIQTTIPKFIDNSINLLITDKNKKNMLGNLAYPHIGGCGDYEYTQEITTSLDFKIFGHEFSLGFGTWDINKNFPISLFGHKLYYAQNTGTSIEFNNKRKAFLFLQTLEINTENLESYLSSVNGVSLRSKIIRLPKSVALFIGSMIFHNKMPQGWLNRCTTKGIDNTTKTYLLPKNNQYFKKSGMFFIASSTDANEKQPYTESKIHILLNSEISDELQKYFEEWSKTSNKTDGWIDIRNEFEITPKENEQNLTNYNDHTFAKLCNNFDKKLTVKFLKQNINKNALENYARIDRVITISEDLNLINNNGGNGVKLILNLLINETLINYSGNGVIDESITQKRVDTIIDKMLAHFIKVKNGTSSTKLETTDSANQTGKEPVSINNNPDLNLACYTYLKTLHDKWVMGFSKDGDKEYHWITNKKPGDGGKTSNMLGLPEKKEDGSYGYYIKNFRFIDRAHNDIGNKILLDFNKLFDDIGNVSVDKTLFSLITDVLSGNQLVFIPMPSYQSFQSRDDLSKIFEPVPYIESNMFKEDTEEDKSLYLCMYTGRPSSKLDNGINKDDGFNLSEDKYNGYDLSTELGRRKIPQDFSLGLENKVPTIGISHGRQNQSYFKNYQLNMSNPNVTDASIKALQQIVDRANQNSTLSPIGQDLFALYSQYAYTCDVEMAGCAQIQPMMYFQLNSVPMWNGVYMIFKIKHSIVPGVMTTKFTGMRMAKTYPKLLTENALSFNLMGTLGTYDLGIAPAEVKDAPPVTFTKDQKFIEATDHFKISDYVGGGKLAIPGKIYNRLKYLSLHIETFYQNFKAKGGEDFNINSGYRENLVNKNDGSAHLLGLACDIQLKSDSTKEKTLELYDSIKTLMYSGLNIDQLLFETENSRSYWVHIGLAKHAIKGDKSLTPKMSGNRYTSEGECANMIENKKDKNSILIIPYAKWPEQATTPVNTKNATKLQLQNQKDVKIYLKSTAGLDKYKVAGLMGNIWQESTFSLDSTNKGGISTGLVHWSKGGKYGNDVNEIKGKIGSTVNSQLSYLMSDAKYITWKTKTFTTIESATESFMNIFEGCSNCMEEVRNGAAADFYNRFSTVGDDLYW